MSNTKNMKKAHIKLLASLPQSTGIKRALILKNLEQYAEEKMFGKLLYFVAGIICKFRRV